MSAFEGVAGDKLKVYLPLVAIVFLVLYFIFSKIKKTKVS